MLNPALLFMLNETEEAQAKQAEAFIDNYMTVVVAASPATKKFVIPTADVSKVVDAGLSLKVKAEIVERYKEAGWSARINDKDGTFVFVHRKRRAKKAKPVSEDAEKPEPTETPEPEAVETAA